MFLFVFQICFKNFVFFNYGVFDGFLKFVEVFDWMDWVWVSTSFGGVLIGPFSCEGQGFGWICCGWVVSFKVSFEDGKGENIPNIFLKLH